MKSIQHNKYLVTTVATDGLVLQHDGINSHTAKHSPMRLHGLKG